MSAATPRKIRAAKTTKRKRSPRKRREQQRSIDTQRAILDAALIEFADKGFEGASTRGIAARAGLPQPLIAYHFRSKDALWRAAAQCHFAEIRKLWDDSIPHDSAMTPADRIRVEFRTFLQFTVQHPHFHHFMIREGVSPGPRLNWMVKTVIAEIMERTLPQIRAAQKDGDLPPGNPILLHYMLIGMTSVLSTLGGEMLETSGIVASDPKIVDAYWKLMERTIFGK